MSDVFTKAKRSEVMSRVRSRGNKATELALVRLMRAEGITGWRRQQRFFGRPDFVFRKERVAVFVDGCLWHRLPAARHLAEAERQILAGEDPAQPGTGPQGDADAAERGLDGGPHLGARAEEARTGAGTPAAGAGV